MSLPACSPCQSRALGHVVPFLVGDGGLLTASPDQPDRYGAHRWFVGPTHGALIKRSPLRGVLREGVGPLRFVGKALGRAIDVLGWGEL